jgi:transcriptional regulator with XRE-family HTH domain
MPYEKISNNIASALKVARTAKELTQEDFALVSSRTYLSTLERGMKSPTLNKLEDLAQVLEIHPLTLMALAYFYRGFLRR